MKKNILSLIMFGFAFFFLIAIPQGFSDELEINDTDLNEVKVMDTSFGKEVRILQLQRSIDKNILMGETVILELSNVNETIEFERLLELIEMLNQVKTDLDELNLDKNESLLALDFVALKKQAINITKEFRFELKNYDDLLNKSEIRGFVNDEFKEVQNQYRERIKEKIANHNKEKAKKMISKMGIMNNSINLDNVSQNYGELKKQILNQIKTQAKEKKQDVLGKIKEQEMKQKISEREINNTLKENIRNRFTEKRNEINQKLIQKREMIQNKLREVIERQRQIKNIHGNRSNSNQTINDRLNSVIDKINASINNRPENNDTTQGLGNSNNRGGKNE